MARRRKLPPVSIYPVEQAERLAKIMGESSATAAALREFKRRQEAGMEADPLATFRHPETARHEWRWTKCQVMQGKC